MSREEKGAAKDVVELPVEKDEEDEEKGISVLDLYEGFYPQDTYAFVAKFGPRENIECFVFGILVFVVQVMFLFLMILNIVAPKYSSTDVGDGDHPFIPGDVETVVKVAQYLAIVSFIFFADDTILDVVTGVDMLPLLSKKKKEDKIGCLYLSSFLRFFQGGLATLVSFLLIFTGPDVKEIVLNFTAINFISSLDGVAFELAAKGHYGAKLKKAALKLQEEELPSCISEKNFAMFRKNFFLFVILVAMFSFGGYFTANQMNGTYITQRFRVEFGDSNFETFSGCYEAKKDSTKGLNSNRFVFGVIGDEDDDEKMDINFGYCKTSQQWFLFYNNEDVGYDSCKALTENEVLSYSYKTKSFDVQDTFSSPWFTAGGSPLDIQFLEKTDGWSEAECGQAFGDGKCFAGFNSIDYDYDGGDCCGATCENSKCGVGAMTNAFNTSLDISGDGFPYCEDPVMEDIIIRITSIETTKSFKNELVNTTPPLLSVDCDERKHLRVNLLKEIENKNETVKASDGATCSVIVNRDEDDASEPIWSDVEYEVYQYQMEANKTIAILNGTNIDAPDRQFQLVPKCYFAKVQEHFNLAELHRNNTFQSNAIYWLMSADDTETSCDDFFLERYALAVITFGIIGDIGIGSIEQCTWSNVICDGGAVVSLDFGGIYSTGGIATEIGLLRNLSSFNAPDIDLVSTLPSELRELSEMKKLVLTNNKVFGTLPAEFGELSQLQNLELGNNALTGTLSAELGQLKLLQVLDLEKNQLEGPVPPEFGGLVSLEELRLGGNDLTGDLEPLCETLPNLTVFIEQNCTCCFDSYDEDLDENL